MYQKDYENREKHLLKLSMKQLKILVSDCSQFGQSHEYDEVQRIRSKFDKLFFKAMNERPEK